MPQSDLSEQVNSGKRYILLPIIASKNFRALWIGQSVSRLGDSVMYLALPLALFSFTHSTLSLGMTMTVLMVAQLISLLFSGLVTDSFPRRSLLLLTDLVRMLAVLSFTLLSAARSLTLTRIDIIVFVFGLMEGLFGPAYSAVRAEVFRAEFRNAAGALSETSNQFAQLLGPVFGGLLISMASTTAAFGFDSLTFLISIVSLCFLRLENGTHRANSNNEQIRTSFLHQIIGGIQVIKETSWLWLTIIAASLANVVFGSLMAIMIPWLIKIRLGLPAYDYGIAVSGFGLGALLVALIFGLRSRWKRRGILSYTGLFIAHAALFCVVLTTLFPMLVFIMFVAGAGFSIMNLIWETSLQELVPAEVFGRVASIDMLGSFGLLPLGYLFTGWLAQTTSGVATISGESIIMLVVILGFLLIPAIRGFD